MNNSSTFIFMNINTPFIPFRYGFLSSKSLDLKFFINNFLIVFLY